MAQNNVSVLKNAETVFSWSVAHLNCGSLKDLYLDQSAKLSRDARRLTMILLSRTLFAEHINDIPQDGWEDLFKVTDNLDQAELASIHALFPEFGDANENDGIIKASALSEMAFFYERMKNYEARFEKGEILINSSRTTKKRSGAFFTPLSVCTFMVRAVLDPLLKEAGKNIDCIKKVRVIDPAMGCGQFLLAASEVLCAKAALTKNDDILDLRRRLFESSLYGIDLDPENIDIARFLAGLYCNKPNIELLGLKQGDALINTEENQIFGKDDFPECLFSEMDQSFDGFDAIVGNPPYVATKNVSLTKYKALLTGASQVDFYLLFIYKYAVSRFLRPGGGICFIVPDPLLLRGNAEGARRQLLEGLDLGLLVHVKGIFPRTHVANVIFLARRKEDERARTVRVALLDKPRDIQTFRKKGEEYLQKFIREIPIEYFENAPRMEFRYLLEENTLKVLSRLNTSRPAKPGPGVVIRPLKALCRIKGAIFRGEEIGKDRIRQFSSTDSEKGSPVLIGGESISAFSVRQDGIYLPEEEVKKDRERYKRQKIIMQKSTGKIIAGYDDVGYVFPQSIYGIIADDPRIGYPFLLTQLNSRLHNYFMHVMYTGYKLLQPQIEIEDINQIPIMVPEFDETEENRVLSLETAKSLLNQYIRTDDPGWILEYVDDCINMGTRQGSALIHDLLDLLGGWMISACTNAEEAPFPKERLAWVLDLVIYRIFGLGLDEIETVESFFMTEEDLSDTTLPEENEIPEDHSEPLLKSQPPVFGENGSTS